MSHRFKLSLGFIYIKTLPQHSYIYQDPTSPLLLTIGKYICENSFIFIYVIAFTLYLLVWVVVVAYCPFIVA